MPVAVDNATSGVRVCVCVVSLCHTKTHKKKDFGRDMMNI